MTLKFLTNGVLSHVFVPDLVELRKNTNGEVKLVIPCLKVLKLHLINYLGNKSRSIAVLKDTLANRAKRRFLNEVGLMFYNAIHLFEHLMVTIES